MFGFDRKARGLPLVLALLFSISICGSAQSGTALGEEDSRISIEVEIRGGHPIYRVNGKIASDPLRVLESLWSEKSKSLLVDIMIDPHASFLQLGEAEGLVSKAGFQHSRSYVYSRETGMREEIIRNPSERYSPKP